MGFTNPASTVALASGASVSITGTPTVDAGGSAGLGVTSLPSSAIAATATASGTLNSNGATLQLLPNSSGSTQYVLLSVQISVSGSNVFGTLQGTGTNTDRFCSARNGSTGANTITQFDLQQLTLPVGAGVSMTMTANGEYDVTLYYTTVSSGSGVTGHIISGSTL